MPLPDADHDAVDKPASSPSTGRSGLAWFPAPHPLIPQILLLIASLLVVLKIFMPFDVMTCWLSWGYMSNGHLPWRIYLTRPDCNYPPFMLYVLTLGDAIRRVVHLLPFDRHNLYLVKLPNILAQIAMGLISYRLFRTRFGERYARQVALLFAISLPLYINAALWGQADAILSLAMVVAVAFLMVDRPIRAGAAMGWALTIKLQAVVIVPVLLLYTYRKYGWRTLLSGIGAGIVVIGLLSAPFVVMGAGKGLWSAYFAAAGYYPQRTLNAFNLWGFFFYAATQWSHQSDAVVGPDNVAVLGPLTYRHLSLLLFGVAMAALLRFVWKRPTAQMVGWASALSVLAFFTLCTQMHERYSLPGVVLLALVAPESAFALVFYLVAGFTSAWNQWVILLVNWAMYYRLSPLVKWQAESWIPSFLYISLISCALFAAGMGFVRRLSEEPTEAAPAPPPSA